MPDRASAEPEINIPEVLPEVTAAFRRYEAALNANDVAVLTELFRKAPYTLRYGLAEELYGYDRIAGFRAARIPGQRTIANAVITSFGRDFATASTEFRRGNELRSAANSRAGSALPRAGASSPRI